MDAGDGDAAERIRELTGGGAHVSIDAIGSAADRRGLGALACAAAAATSRSACWRATSASRGVPMAELISRELEIAGVHGMPVRGYPALLRLVASGAVDPARLIGRRIALEEAGAALAAMDRPAEGITVIVAIGGARSAGAPRSPGPRRGRRRSRRRSAR